MSRYLKLLAANPDVKVRTMERTLVFRTLLSWGWPMAAMTLGSTVYLQRKYVGTDLGWEILFHELVHVRQFKRWTIPGFLIAYVLLLPAGPGLRAALEWPAYIESLRVELERTGNIRDSSIDYTVRMFCGSAYWFMFPFPGFVR